MVIKKTMGVENKLPLAHGKQVWHSNVMGTDNE